MNADVKAFVESHALAPADLRFLRGVARRTWRFFETFIADEDNHLPPDNFQVDPPQGIAHRTSPTNIGLYLLSCVAARDFGFIGVSEVGALSALVGIGGGSMTVPLLVAMGARPVRAVGTSATCGFAIALASAAGYVVGGHDASGLPRGSIGFVYLPAAIGIAAASVLCAPYGAALAHRLKGRQLTRVFAGFLWVMGASLLLSR